MLKFLKRLAHDESGVTAIEYGLIAALVAVAIVVGVTALGDNLGTLFNDIAGEIDDQNTL